MRLFQFFDQHTYLKFRILAIVAICSLVLSIIGTLKYSTDTAPETVSTIILTSCDQTSQLNAGKCYPDHIFPLLIVDKK